MRGSNCQVGIPTVKLQTLCVSVMEVSDTARPAVRPSSECLFAYTPIKVVQLYFVMNKIQPTFPLYAKDTFMFHWCTGPIFYFLRLQLRAHQLNPRPKVPGRGVASGLRFLLTKALPIHIPSLGRINVGKWLNYEEKTLNSHCIASHPPRVLL